MKYDYLNDQIFLNLLDKLKIRVSHLKLTLLDFQERPIREISGTASGNGTLNINGESANRRTISFNMLAPEETNNLTNLDNIISLNKKFKVAIGIENPLTQYKHYGDIIWFKLGTYVISKASLSWSTSACTIAISAKDKMCMLDGSVGGTLPTTVVFHEIYEETADGGYVIKYPTLRQIISEALTHYGGESASNIIINDLDDTVKRLVKYGNDTPMWIQTDETEGLGKNIEFSNQDPNKPEKNYDKHVYGEDVGYTLTDFTYPGELILSAGETVVALLNKITGILGNYEFFYDVDGRFIFQRKPTYQDVSYTPVYELNGQSYIRSFNNSKYAYSLKDSETVVSINNNPNYDNIKNDFIVWGERPITNSNSVVPICYRLVIDNKPKLNLCKKHMLRIYNPNDFKTTLRYEFQDNQPTGLTKYDNELAKTTHIVGTYIIKNEVTNKEETIHFEYVAVPAEEWREELYRAALRAAAEGTTNSAYDTELLAYWRDNYDPRPKWDNGLIIPTEFWNSDIKEHPDKISYWLDFIDTTSTLGQYSVSNIGRRTKVNNSKDVRSLFNKDVSDIIFLETSSFENNVKLKNQMELDGQKYCFVNSTQYEYFLASATGSSAFDLIREMLYQHLVYNTQATLTCIPKYYLDANTLIYIQNEKSGVIGDYVIKTISLPLGYSGTMNITANEALTRI